MGCFEPDDVLPDDFAGLCCIVRLSGGWDADFEVFGGLQVYRYDGQMGMQDVDSDASSVSQKTTDYALGARGVDAISTTTSSGTTVAYPIDSAYGEDRRRRHGVARYCDRRLVGGHGVC